MWKNKAKANLFSRAALAATCTNTAESQAASAPKTRQREAGWAACLPSEPLQRPDPEEAAPSPAPRTPLPSLPVSFPGRSPVFGELLCSASPAGRLGYSLAAQGRSGTACVKRPRWYLGAGWCSLVKSFKPEFPFPPRKLSVRKPGLETHYVLNTTVGIFFGYGYTMPS